MSYNNSSPVWARSNKTVQTIPTTTVTLHLDHSAVGNTRYAPATKQFSCANSIVCADAIFNANATFGAHFIIEFIGGTTSAASQRARQVPGWGSGSLTASDTCFTAGTTMSLSTVGDSVINASLQQFSLLIAGVQI